MIGAIFICTCFFVGVGSEFPFFLDEELVKNENQDKNNVEHVLSSINNSINPCDDFYEYACSTWIKQTSRPLSQPVWGHWQAVTERVNQRLQSILESSCNASNYLAKAKEFYKFCVEAPNFENKYLRDLEVVINRLHGWPLASGNNSDFSYYDWTIHVAEVSRLLGINPIIKMHVGINLRNTSQHILYVDVGAFNMPSTILTSPKRNLKYLKIYKIWIMKSVQHIFKTRTNLHLDRDVLDLIKFETNLAKFSNVRENLRTVSVEELSKKIPFDWLKIFKNLFAATSMEIGPTDVVVVKSMNYLEKLVNYTRQIDQKIIANYITWCVVKELSRDTTNLMKTLNFFMDNKIFGIEKDLTNTEECIEKLNKYMGNALVPKYLELHVHPNVTSAASEMVENIKQEFIKLLEENTWLDKDTKILARDKIDAIKTIIGFPKWLGNESMVQEYFKEVKITENHFLNVIKLKQFKAKTELVQLRQQVSEVEWSWSPLEVNAYYNVLQNSILIPLGMLEPPFFQLNRSEVHNYGALGSLVGHEISHALDTTGRHADKSGNIIQWWPQDDIRKYVEATDCFEQQFNNYNIDGELTIGENIADTVGVQVTHRAFLNLGNKYDTQKNNQLFFTSYAQLWCEITNDNEFMNEGEHAPVKTRVLGTVQNNEEFENSFRCRKNTNKCTLW